MDKKPRSMVQPTSSSRFPRDELFRRIGRNVVNFQYLEASLRHLIPAVRWEGTPKDIAVTANEVARKHKKSSLGNLADAFLDRVLAPQQDKSPVEDDSSAEHAILFCLQIEGSPERRAEQRNALRTLVAERNRLIHRQFLAKDLNSAEQCKALCEQLDEQNERLSAQILYLNALRKAHRSAIEEFAKFVQSEEFMSALRGEVNDA